MARNLNINKKDIYIRSLYCKENEKFIDIYNSIETKRNIQITPEEGKLISMILLIHKSKFVLEIGTLAGYSTCWIADSLSENGRITTIENNKRHFDIAKRNFESLNFGKKVNLIHDDAKEYLKNSTSLNTFDAVFIDGKKEDYPKYLKYVYPLIKKEGLIIADNTFLFGSVYDPRVQIKDNKMLEAMKSFNEKISDQRFFKTLIFPTNEGLTIAIKK
ncbi:MAG: putative O-methyltransferase YrrM [Candidatus Midichloriaceae bacterium]|jgi:predicted O-methyltransferase YrrM